MIEHAFAFFLGTVLLILWIVGSMALGYFTTHPFDRHRLHNLGFFVCGIMMQIILLFFVGIGYLLISAILSMISYGLTLL